MPSSSAFGRAIAGAAHSIHDAQGLQQTLQAIAEGACRSIPGFDHAGISSISQPGTEETVAATGALVWELDTLQYNLLEGPSVEAMEKAPGVVAVPDIRHERRWPRYVPDAVQAGLKSQLAVRLCLDNGGTLGGLNLYSTISEDIDPDAESLAELFAAHAAIALGSARKQEGLNTALQSRKVIGQALGILMERYDMAEDRAFEFLLRTTSSSNMKLRDVAQELIDQRNDHVPNVLLFQTAGSRFD
jgi:GAF domain-containing protein